MIEGFQVFQHTRNHWTTGPHGFAVRTARHFVTGFDDVVHVAADLMTRRSLAAPLVGTKPRAHGEQSALPLASRTRTLPRPPQARLANMTTTRSPPKDEPGWATHTSFPNFGKVEYFREDRLTEGDTEEVP